MIQRGKSCCGAMWNTYLLVNSRELLCKWKGDLQVWSAFQTFPKRCIRSCHYRLINNMCSNVRELCVSQLCPWQSLQGLLALTARVFMHETSRQIVGRAGQFLSDERQLAASLPAFFFSSSSSSSTLLSFPSWQTQRKSFMEPYNDTWQMCSTGVIVNGGSCADSLDDGKSVGPHFGLPVWILMARFQAMANDEENSLIKTWCDGQRPAGSLETVKVNSVPSGVRS